MLPTLGKSFEEASVEPNLFLVDENIAIALCYNELLYSLSNIFAKNFRALKFFTKLDVAPSEID